MGPSTQSTEDYPQLENVQLQFIFPTKSVQSPFGIWYIYGTDQIKYNVTIALSQDDRLKFANFINDLQPYLRDKLIRHIQKETRNTNNHHKQIYYLSLYMKEKIQIYTKRLLDSHGFKSITKHQIFPNDKLVNTFTDLNHIYHVYRELSKSRDYILATPLYPQNSQLLAINEKQVEDELTHNLKFDIDPILLGDQEKPIELFKDFRELYLNNFKAYTDSLEHNAQNILNWSIFKFASTNNNLSLDFVLQKTELLSQIVNSLTALFFAKHLGNKNLVSEDDWFKFKTTSEYKTLLPLRKILIDLKQPLATRILEQGQQGMSIEAAFKDFKNRLIN